MGVRSNRLDSLRVLVISRNYPRPAAPASGPYVKVQVSWLRHWHEVRVVSPVSVAPYISEFRQAGTVTAWLREWRTRVRTMRTSDDALAPLWLHLPKRPFEASEGLMLAGALLAQKKRLGLDRWTPDVVHGHFVFPDGFAAVLLARVLHKPVVVTAHGSDLNLLPNRGRIIGGMIRWTLQNADAVIAVSRALSGTACELGAAPEKVHFVPNGFEESPSLWLQRREARARLGLPQDDRIVLYVGNLYPVKRLDLLLRAYGALDGRAIGTRLIVVGEGFLRPNLERLAAQLGLGGRVTFVGVRPPHEIPLWMRASDLVVLPSDSEGWPTVVTEALAAGRPVVATRVGAVPELIASEDLGLVVPPGDERGLSSALLEALALRWDEDRIRALAPVRPWREIAAKISQIYCKVARR